MVRGTVVRRGGPALMLGGILWVAARFLVTFDPPPLTYDGYNRLFTLPLLFILVGWAAAFAVLRRRADRSAQRGWAVALVGLAVMLVGNVVEFWGVMLQDRPNAYAAMERGEAAWAGSAIGWMVFGLGHLLVVVGMALVGIAALRGDGLPRWRGLPLTIAALGLLWPVLSFTAVGDFAVMAATGGAWALLGYVFATEAASVPVGSGRTAG